MESKQPRAVVTGCRRVHPKVQWRLVVSNLVSGFDGSDNDQTPCQTNR